MKYSPKLKKAMQQIKNILDAEDIAGMIVLHTPGYSEFLNKLNPSYSCLIHQKTPDPKTGELFDGIRIKAKASEVGIEKRDQLLKDTANLLTHFNEIGGTLVMQNIQVQELFETKIEIIKGDGDISSTESQNN